MTHSSVIPAAGAQRHLTPALMLSHATPEELAARRERARRWASAADMRGYPVRARG